MDQDALPGQSQVVEVGPRVEEVQETMDIHQQPLVVSQSEDMTGGGSSKKAGSVVSSTARFPSDTPRFLAKFELLLSETELADFQQQFVAGNFNVDNPPYQSWLVLKRATLPAAETQAAE